MNEFTESRHEMERLLREMTVGFLWLVRDASRTSSH